MAGSSGNFIPRPDGRFGAWSRQFYESLKIWWLANGLKESDLVPLEGALTQWELLYAEHVAAAAAAEAARQAKDAARAALEAAERPLARFVQAYPATTNSDRATLGLPVRDTSLTPVAPPTSRPLVRVDTSSRLLHVLRFSDEAAPTARRKPHGTLGAEVWLTLAPPAAPTPPVADFRFVAVSSRGTLRQRFSPAQAGQTAHYALRWVNTRGERGPWSEPAAATVVA